MIQLKAKYKHFHLNENNVLLQQHQLAGLAKPTDAADPHHTDIFRATALQCTIIFVHSEDEKEDDKHEDAARCFTGAEISRTGRPGFFGKRYDSAGIILYPVNGLVRGNIIDNDNFFFRNTLAAENSRKDPVNNSFTIVRGYDDAYVWLHGKKETPLEAG